MTRIVHVPAGNNEPVGYVRCLPSGAVHPSGSCHVQVRSQLRRDHVNTNEWALEAARLALANGHEMGHWHDGSGWGANLHAWCLDCNRDLFVGRSGAVSGAASRERCEWVGGILTNEPTEG